MSARIRLSVASEPVDHFEADLAVVGCLSDERPLRGAAARCDWRLCGALSSLLASGALRGEEGEAALLPSPGGVRAPRVLTLGLGPRARRRGERLRAFAGDALERVAGLRAPRVALALLPGEQGGVRDQLEELVAGFAGALAEGLDEVEVSLWLLVPALELSEAREVLAHLSTQHWPEGVEFPEV